MDHRQAGRVRWRRVIASTSLIALMASCGGGGASEATPSSSSDAGGTGSVAAPGSSSAGSSGGAVKIMPLGDSITGSCCYRQLLWTQLQSRGYRIDFVGSLKGNDMADDDHEGHGNYAVADITRAAGAGQYTGEYYRDARDLVTWFGPQATAPDIVLMHFGTNDRWGNESPTRILAGYSALLAAARAKNPNVTFLVAQILPMAPADVRPLNAAIPAWATANSTSASRIVVVDQYTGFNLAWTNDGVHPDGTTGSQWLADRWMNALTAVLR